MEDKNIQAIPEEVAEKASAWVPNGAKKAESPVSERAQAFGMRAAWMNKMGFSQEEIAEACADDGSPIDLQEEQEHWHYANKLDEITPPASVLKSLAIKR